MNEEAKKKLLRKIPYGLYVIGVKSGDEYHGFTGSWLTQASMKPPMITLGVREGSHGLEMIKAGKVLTVNFFPKKAKDLVAEFFKPAPKTEGRLAGHKFHTDITGAPILDEAIGYLECEVKKIIEGHGDHALVLAEVVEAKVKEDVDSLIMSDTPWHYGG